MLLAGNSSYRRHYDLLAPLGDGGGVVLKFALYSVWGRVYK